MYIISTRANFINPDDNHKNAAGIVVPQIREADIRSGKIGNKNITDLPARLAGKRVLILIHGYNNTWDNVRGAYNILSTNFRNILAKHTPSQYDEIVGFIWPGGDSALEYGKAKKRVKAHFESLANLILELVSEKTEDNKPRIKTTIDIMAHSLGCYLTLSALTFYMPTIGAQYIRNLFLMAAAVDDELIQYGEHFYRATQTCKTVYVFHSKQDTTLRVWYRLGDVGGAALGCSGPEDWSIIEEHSPNVKVINCKRVVKSHGDYKYNEQVFIYLFKELTQDKPSRQFVVLKP